jgi:uncharacterized protein YegL
MSEPIIDDVEFTDNANQRLPCVILVDCSESMSGASIKELNDGLRVFEDALKSDDIASQRVQLLVIGFGGDQNVQICTDWTDAMAFTAPRLTASGMTPMGAAVRTAIAKIEEQKIRYKTFGIPYNRPWIFLLTDGEATDDWHNAAAECRRAEQDGRLVFFGVGVGPRANLAKLGRFSVRQPVSLQGLRFKELFLWLSQSASSVSRTARGSTVQLPPPTDWMQVST